jgi:hypothetical protein
MGLVNDPEVLAHDRRTDDACAVPLDEAVKHMHAHGSVTGPEFYHWVRG